MTRAALRSASRATRRFRSSIRAAAVACAATVGSAALMLGAAEAQIIEVPTWQLDGPILNHLQDVDVAVATNSTMVFIWAEYDLSSLSKTNDHAVTQWFNVDGSAIAEPLVVDTSGHVFSPQIASDTRGGHVAAWQWINYPQQPGYAFFGRVLDVAGRPAGDLPQPDFRIDERFGGVMPYTRVAGLPSGSVFVWDENGLLARLYDEHGEPRGSSFFVDPVEPSSERQDVAVLPDGGFVIAWRHPWAAQRSRGRIFDGDGNPRGDTFTIHDTLRVERVAASPEGDLAATLIDFILEPDGETFHYELYLQRMDPAGALVGEPSLVAVSDDNFSFVDPDLDFDYHGNILVVWSEYRTNPWTARNLKARGFDPAGNPLSPTFEAGNTPSVEGRTHRMRSFVYGGSGFVNVWYAQGEAFGSIVSLCRPEVSLCGDGVVADQCEQCDDGAANSDTTPDACRSDCTPARCGDGVTDSNEDCDDGNRTGCDGCSTVCRTEVGGACGDGAVLAACGEQCDDGDTLGGDGCSQGCEHERIPGGGSEATDCYNEWRVSNPTNLPFRDFRGNVSNEQECVDNDPACDFDGGVAGSCTFHVSICTRMEDSQCNANLPLTGWQLRSPSEGRAARSPAMALTRASLLQAASTIGGTSRDVCSDFVNVVVPMRLRGGAYGDGQLRLKAVASTQQAADKDGLRLSCAAAHEDPVDFHDVWARVLWMKCASCHIRSQTCCGSLDFHDTQTSYASLVGQTGEQCPAETLVVPGDPEASLLYRTLIDSSACALRMPARSEVEGGFRSCQAGECLGADGVEYIRRWIEEGARP